MYFASDTVLLEDYRRIRTVRIWQRLLTWCLKPLFFFKKKKACISSIKLTKLLLIRGYLALIHIYSSCTMKLGQSYVSVRSMKLFNDYIFEIWGVGLFFFFFFGILCEHRKTVSYFKTLQHKKTNIQKTRGNKIDHQNTAYFIYTNTNYPSYLSAY